ACCAVAMPAAAITVTRVDVSGLDDERMAENVRVSLALNDAVGKDISTRRLNYLLREAEAETREALEPFGYYSPTIVVQRSDRDVPEGTEVDPDARRAARGNGNGGARGERTLTVSIRIEPGKPVRVRGFDVGVDGPGADDRDVASALAAFAPRQGEVLDHTLYEAGKSRVNRALAGHGYFDADFAAHRVEVTRAEHAADIALRWTSGERYALGTASFSQAPK